MIKYKDFSPSAVDRGILFYDERDEWLVAPCTVTRDSEVLEQSNWAVMLNDLESLEDGWEVHRFGHWGCGWFEMVIVEEGSKAHELCEDIESALADYPVLSEMDFAERKHAATIKFIESCGYEDAESIYAYLSNPDDADEDAIHRAALNAVPEEFDDYDLAQIADCDEAQLLAEALDRAPEILGMYAELCPEYAEKAMQQSNDICKSFRARLVKLAQEKSDV